MKDIFVNRFTRRNRDRFSCCRRVEGEQDVQNGLAMTPAQMFDMASKGLPVTTRNLGVTYDEGYSNLDFTPPLEHRRGIDLGDLYEARMDAKSKLRGLKDSGHLQKAIESSIQGAAAK